jgi:hypothetical protein
MNVLFFLVIIIENEPSASIRPVQNHGFTFEETLEGSVAAVDKFLMFNCLEGILT